MYNYVTFPLSVYFLWDHQKLDLSIFGGTKQLKLSVKKSMAS